jgi:hypothetical protein
MGWTGDGPNERALLSDRNGPLVLPRSPAGGRSTEASDSTELLDLEPEDIREALRYAAEAVRERKLPLLPHSS